MANEIAGFGSFEISACKCYFWNMSRLGMQVFFILFLKKMEFRHEIDIGSHFLFVVQC